MKLINKIVNWVVLQLTSSKGGIFSFEKWAYEILEALPPPVCDFKKNIFLWLPWYQWSTSICPLMAQGKCRKVLKCKWEIYFTKSLWRWSRVAGQGCEWSGRRHSWCRGLLPHRNTPSTRSSQSFSLTYLYYVAGCSDWTSAVLAWGFSFKGLVYMAMM